MSAVTRWVVRLHKWLALIVGLQIFLWVLGGFGMSLMPIEQVRAEHTIPDRPAPQIDLTTVLSPADAAARAELGAVEHMSLGHWHAGPVYRFTTHEGLLMVDATTGQRRSPITQADAEAAARYGYAGDADIVSIAFFEEPNWEYRRPNPSWQIVFDDDEGTRVYVNANTGLIDARRNDMWRLFDFLWMLHIMDYDEREDFNHPLLIGAAGLALSVVIFGMALLVLRMRRMVLVARRARKPLT